LRQIHESDQIIDEKASIIEQLKNMQYGS